MNDSRLGKDFIYFCHANYIYTLPIAFLIYLVLESYQIDFRSFYLAGKSVLNGFDPYLNYVGIQPEFYGPINSESSFYSGFRYPPLAALIFAPLGIMPYQTSKAIFSLAMIGVLGTLIFQISRRQAFTVSGEAILFVIISFPILGLIERGQIDILIVYLVSLSYWLRKQKRTRLLSTFLLALASVFKIFPAVVVFYYVLRKQWSYVAQTLLWIAILLISPLFYFGRSVYHHFLQRTFPEIFGPIASNLPIDLHGQGIFLNRIVQSVDSIELIANHNFVNGYMNPLLQDSTTGSILSGLILSGIMLIAVRNLPEDYKFYAFLNVINFFNPVAWIMGVTWYLPSFLYLFHRASLLGRFFLLLPLFMPPFLNTNAIWAFVVAILFALALKGGRFGKVLLSGISSFTQETPHT